MKVIDLLNKIANGEIPKKIIYDDKQWTYDEKLEDYITYDDSRIDWKYTIMEYINDEIEIIEEHNKIKRIQSCGDNLYSEYIGQWLVNKENYTEYDELLMNKINEIIDKLNKED